MESVLEPVDRLIGEQLSWCHLHGSINDKAIPRKLLVLSSQFRASRPALGDESLPLLPVPQRSWSRIRILRKHSAQQAARAPRRQLHKDLSFFADGSASFVWSAAQPCSGHVLKVNIPIGFP